jgi:predicted O-methyltransferase YrrM
VNSSVIDFLSGYGNGINEIKLKDLLTLKNICSDDEQISTLFPPVEIGSITLVDQIVLLSLLKITQPEKVLEVGTYLGYSTTLLALNSDATIFSLDLPTDACLETQFDSDKILTDGDVNDDFLRHTQSIEGAVYLKNLTAEQRGRVNLIKKDSTQVNFQQAFGELDYVFVDGGHAYDIIKSDTENALQAVRKGVVIWHDYASGIHSDVTQYLNSRDDLKIFHVKNSLCAFAFTGC